MGKKTMQDRDLDQKNNTRTIMLQRVGGINITRLDESSSSTPRLCFCATRWWTFYYRPRIRRQSSYKDSAWIA